MSAALPCHDDAAVSSRCGDVRLILASGFQPDYVREVANAHARLGYRVFLVGGDMHQGQNYLPDVSFLNLRGDDRRDTNPVREVVKLARYLARLVYCVASSGSTTVYDVSIGRPLLRCVLMYPLLRSVGARIVYTAHNVMPHDADTMRNRIVYWIVYRVLVDAIVVHGQAIKERLIAEFGVGPARVHAVAHGTYRALDRPEITKRDARQRLGIAADERVVLCCGLQRHYKGTHFAIGALDGYDAKGMRLVVRGHAPDSEYRGYIERLAREHRGPVAVDVRFGAVPGDELELLFKACDVVLLPYLEGSQSGVKFMAYAYGRPVLASDVGSLPEDVVPGVTGEVFACGDAAAFRVALERMLAGIDSYAPGRIAEYAREHCSFDTAARQVDAVCAALARRRV
ncbi:MAG: glycosyltransferase family 4 protein [Candidatus Hydrogenedentes bacterium]|nr:glycosyltransferase family 4 protein [Candidatus Hydrogenedentota bacterium]